MTISGYKTISMFSRYNITREQKADISMGSTPITSMPSGAVPTVLASARRSRGTASRAVLRLGPIERAFRPEKASPGIDWAAMGGTGRTTATEAAATVEIRNIASV